MQTNHMAFVPKFVNSLESNNSIKYSEFSDPVGAAEISGYELGVLTTPHFGASNMVHRR